MDKEWFEQNNPAVNILAQLDMVMADSSEAYEEKRLDLYRKLRDKPILNGHELMLLPSMPDDYLIEQMVWKGDVIIVLASEKTGKSLFTLQMACALTCGDHFLDTFEVPDSNKVLYIQAEGTREETQQRLASMTHDTGVEWNPDNFYHMYPPALSLDTENGLNDICNKIYATKFEPTVIFLDPLYMAMEGSLVDEKHARLFCRNIRVLKERFSSSVVINHHKRRPVRNDRGSVITYSKNDDEILGSFVWKAFPSHIIDLTARKDGTCLLSIDTQRSGIAIKNMSLKLTHPTPLMFRTSDKMDCAPFIEHVYSYVEKAGKPVTTQDVVDGTGLSKTSVSNAFSFLLSKNVKRLAKSSSKRRPVYYSVR